MTVPVSLFLVSPVSAMPVRMYNVKPVLKNHGYERPPVFKDHIFVARRPTVEPVATPPVLRDQIWMPRESSLSRQVLRYINLANPGL